jgi:hypothetical protein
MQIARRYEQGFILMINIFSETLRSLWGRSEGRERGYRCRD